jgi:hypothetical protein
VTKYLVEWDTDYRFKDGVKSSNSHVIAALASDNKYKIGESGLHVLTTDTYYYVRVTAYTNTYGPSAVFDEGGIADSHFSATSAAQKDHSSFTTTRIRPTNVAPTKQKPYMPDGVTIEVSQAATGSNAPDQIDTYFWRPTVNTLGFVYDPSIDGVEYYTVSWDPEATFDSNAGGDGPEGSYNVPIEGAGQCQSASKCLYQIGSESQRLKVAWTGTTTAGSYRLRYDPGDGRDVEYTACIGWDASAADVANALKASANAGKTTIDNVQVRKKALSVDEPGTDKNGYVYYINFIGHGVRGDQEQLTVVDSGGTDTGLTANALLTARRGEAACAAWDGDQGFAGSQAVSATTVQNGGTLTPGKKYYVRVHAVNTAGSSVPKTSVCNGPRVGAGDGQSCATATAWVIPRSPPLEPRVVEAWALYDVSDTIRISWEAPASEEGAAIDQYKVEWSDQTSGFGTWYGEWTGTLAQVTAHTPNPTTGLPTYQHNVTGLTSGRQYKFRVTAHNDQGWGSDQASNGHCSVSTTTPCDQEGDCPATETCNKLLADGANEKVARSPTAVARCETWIEDCIASPGPDGTEIIPRSLHGPPDNNILIAQLSKNILY